MYKCKKPFNTQKGQFTEGEHTLVVGIDENTVMTGKSKVFKMKLGTSETVYSLTREALQKVEHHLWTNPKGKSVWIVPLEHFEAKHPNPIKFATPKPKEDDIQTSLFS